MDENPYRSPVAAGAAQPGMIGRILSLVIWLGLGLLGLNTVVLGVAMVGAAAYRLTVAPGLEVLFIMTLGVITCWLGAFLVVRAIRRFRRRTLPMDQRIG